MNPWLMVIYTSIFALGAYWFFWKTERWVGIAKLASYTFVFTFAVEMVLRRMGEPALTWWEDLLLRLVIGVPVLFALQTAWWLSGRFRAWWNREEERHDERAK